MIAWSEVNNVVPSFSGNVCGRDIVEGVGGGGRGWMRNDLMNSLVNLVIENKVCAHTCSQLITIADMDSTVVVHGVIRSHLAGR